jgi:sulfite reductase (ferredoxin)
LCIDLFFAHDHSSNILGLFSAGKVEPWREMAPWKYSDWMGWHEHGNGELFLGLNVEQGRVKDEGGVQMKTLLRKLADAPYNFDMLLTPTQSIIIKVE